MTWEHNSNDIQKHRNGEHNYCHLASFSLLFLIFFPVIIVADRARSSVAWKRTWAATRWRARTTATPWRSWSSPKAFCPATLSTHGPVSWSFTAATAWWHLHSNSWTTNPRSVHSTHCILSISWVLKFYKCKSRWVSCHPHILQSSIFAKRWFQVTSSCVTPQVSNIDLAFKVPFTMARHPLFVQWKRVANKYEIGWIRWMDGWNLAIAAHDEDSDNRLHVSYLVAISLTSIRSSTIRKISNWLNLYNFWVCWNNWKLITMWFTK